MHVTIPATRYTQHTVAWINTKSVGLFVSGPDRHFRLFMVTFKVTSVDVLGSYGPRRFHRMES